MFEEKAITKYGDIGTPERHARRELETITVDGQPRTTVKKISPIHYYYRQKQVDLAQFSAGHRLYLSYMAGWVGYGGCEYHERTDGGGKRVEMADSRVDAQKSYKKGIEAAGKYKDVIEKVILKEMHISDIHTHWYTRKKEKDRLKKGLTLIAKAYGYC